MKKFIKPKVVGTFLALTLALSGPMMASAHCDTVEGPTVTDGLRALESNNINYALKWVTPENENEIKQIFVQAMKVRNQGSDAKELADKYFLENLVRIHRAGEGAPYTGIKPLGTPIAEIELLADKSIEIGNLSPVEKFVPRERLPEVKERFEKVMKLKDFDVNDVQAGREYVEAYVSYLHYTEGAEEEGHESTEHAHGNHESQVNEKWNMEVDSIVSNGQVLVPMRQVFEGAGAEVEWNQKEQSVLAKVNGQTILVKLDDSSALLNNKEVKLHAKPVMKNNLTFIPLEVVKHMLELKAEVDHETHVVKLQH